MAGILRLGERAIDPMIVKRLCDAIAHRGPDDAGYVFFEPGRRADGRGGYWCNFVDSRFRHLNEHLPVFGGQYANEVLSEHQFSVALGHRRLAILDLSHHGHQPMCTPDQRYWIVYNGETYNFRELRRHLEAEGYSFRTQTDTEVVLQLWEKYGHESLAMLNGMFALALYDRLENKLVLARDRFGVKPLYFSRERDHFLFASEPKAILRSGLSSPEINARAMVEYFTFQNLLGSETLWKGIQLLAPGESLTIHPGERSFSRQYFHARFPELDPALRDRTVVADELSEHFVAAVRRQLVSDVPVGSYLSGGMDSGSIVAVAGRQIPRMHTFTAGFDLTNVDGIEQGFDERPQAERLSYLLQTEHYAVVLHGGDMPAAMERISWHMDDPRVGMCHQIWYVAKLASRFVKVCLAGTGGDELFAGYPWRYRYALAAHGLRNFEELCFQHWHRLLPRPELPALFARDFEPFLKETPSRLAAVLERAPRWSNEASTTENLLQLCLYFELSTFLQGLLITEDRISMAHGMETRVPFLDNELADLAWRIPPSLKVRTSSLDSSNRDRFVSSADGKICLRKAMEGHLPREFVYQQKQGFSPPDENWYRGPSMAYIKEILLDRSTRSRPWFDQEFVRTRLDEHFEGRRNHRLLIWSLLSFEWIQRHYITSGASRKAPVGNERP